MATLGLTNTGFVTQALADIRVAFETAVRGALGISIPLGDRTLLGVIIGILSEALSLLWDLAQAIYAARDADAATGQGLEIICSYTGTFREPATHSEVVLTFCGTNGTLVAAGDLSKASSTSTSWQTTEDVTLASVSAWGTHVYVVGDRVTNVGQVYQCTVGGTSANPNTPIGTDPTADIIDSGGVHWRWIGTGGAAADADAISVDTGAIVGLALDISVPQTPVIGRNTVLNLSDAIAGSDVQPDQDLRITREAELAAEGVGTQDSIKAALVKADEVNILAVDVLVNNTDVTDSNGLPPRSVKVVIRTTWAPDAVKDQLIVDTIFAQIGAEYTTVGSSSGTVTDSEGNTHTINFSRPTEVPIYVDVTLTYDASSYEGDTVVKQAIVTFGNKSKPGKDAVAAALGSKAFTVNGVIDVPRSGSIGGCKIATTPGPTTDTTIAMSFDQIPTFDTAHVTVHSTPAVP